MAEVGRQWGRGLGWTLGLIFATVATSTVWLLVHMVREQREALPYSVFAVLGAAAAAVFYLVLFAWPRSVIGGPVGISLLSLIALAVDSSDDTFSFSLVPTVTGALIAGAVVLRSPWPSPRPAGPVGSAVATLLAVPAAGLLWLALGVVELELRTDWAQDWYGYRVDHPGMVYLAPAWAVEAGVILVGAAIVAVVASRRLPPMLPLLTGAALLAGAIWSITDAIRTDHPPAFAGFVDADPISAMRLLALELPGGGEALTMGMTLALLGALRWYQSGNPLRPAAADPHWRARWSRWVQDSDLEPAPVG